MHINRAICDSGHAPAAVAAGRPRHAFTLVELMVVIVIIGILASLTLAGLAGVRQRAKIEKTKSTIRKIDAVIQPMYESYLTRRVPLAPSRLQNIRTLMAAEMPDNWTDATVPLVGGVSWALTAGPRRFRQTASSLSSNPNWASRQNWYQSAECLFMIVAIGGYDPWAIENFRNDEIGDIDGDGAREFHDGWGRPIFYVRWPVGFPSLMQAADPVANPDPFDPTRISGPPLDFGLIPLIYSPGPDESLNDPLSTSESGYGLEAGPPLIGKNLTSLRKLSPVPATVKDPAAVRDNITNHDLIKK